MALTLGTINATSNSDFLGGMTGKLRAVTRDSGGVTAGNFGVPHGDTVKLTGSTAHGVVGADTKVSFNNSTGAITVNDAKLDLKGIANPLTDRGIKIQVHNGGINVYTSDGVGYRLNADGTQDTDTEGNVKVASQPFDADAGALIINNGNAENAAGDGRINNGGDGNDVIINRQEDAIIDGGAGNDAIFNFAKKITSISGGAGDDSIFSVGLTEGTLQSYDAVDDGGNDYIRITSAMTGGSIKMGDGKNVIDASGVALTNVEISDIEDAASTALLAKSITNTGDAPKTVTLKAAETAVDVSTLATDLTFGAGANSLVSDTVKNVEIKSAGENSFSLKNVSDAKFTVTGDDGSYIGITGSAKNTEFTLGEGNNHIDAKNKTLSSVTISDANGGADAITTIEAGSITGTAAAKSSITLAGTADSTSGVNVTGAITNTDITITKGQGVLNAKTYTGGEVNMSVGNDQAQEVTIGGAVKDLTMIMSAGLNTVNIAGAANNLDYTGGAKDDKVIIEGAVSNSKIDLGASDTKNELYVRKGGETGKGQAITNSSITAAGVSTIGGGAFKASAAEHKIDLTGDFAYTVELDSVSGTKTQQAVINMTGAAAQNLTINGKSSYMTYNGSTTKNDTVTLLGASNNSIFDLGAGVNTLTAQKNTTYQALKDVKITSSGTDAADATTVKAGAYSASDGTNFGINLGGKGANTVELASITGKSAAAAVEIKLGSSDTEALQTLKTTGAVKNLSYVGGKAGDLVHIQGAISDSKFNLGTGANNFYAVKGADPVAATTGFQSMKNVDIQSSGAEATDTTTIKGGAYSVTSAGYGINLASKGTNNVTLSSVTGKDNDTLAAKFTLGTADATVAQNLTVNGAVKNLQYTGSKGNDTVHIKGAVSDSKFDLGAGGADKFYAVKAETADVATAAKSTYQSMKNVDIKTTGTETTDTATIIGGAYSVTSAGYGITLAGKGSNSVTLGSVAGKNTTDTVAKFQIGNAEATTAQTLSILGAAKNLEYTGTKGNDTVHVRGAVSDSKFNLGAAGADKFYAVNAELADVLTADSKTYQAMKNVDIKNTGTEATDSATIIGGAYTTNSTDYNITLASKGTSSVTLNSIAGKGSADADRVKIQMGDAGGTTAQSLIVNGTVKNLNYTGTKGNDNVLLKGAVSDSKFDLSDGTNQLSARKTSHAEGALQSMKNVDIVAAGDTSANTITVGAYTTGADGNSISLGKGVNTVTLGSVTGGDGKELTVEMGGATGGAVSTATTAQNLTVEGASKYLNYYGAAGIDTILLKGATNNSSFALGAGADVFTAENDKGSRQALTDTSIVSTDGGATVKAGAYSGNKDNSIDLQGAAATNSLELASISGKGKEPDDRAVIKMAGTANLTVNGAVKNLNYTGGAGADTIKIVSSSVSDSKFTLGDGANLFQAGLKYNDGTDVLETKGATMTKVDIIGGTGDDMVRTGLFKSGEVDLGAGQVNGKHAFVE